MNIDTLQSDFDHVQEKILQGPIYPCTTPDEVRAHLRSRYSFADPIDLQEAAADVERMLSAWQVQVTHPRYFGLFNPSVRFASVIADTLTAMYNPQVATWRTSPAACEIERHTLAWLASKFGLPADTIATFTSGGAEANFSAVVVALTRAFPGFGEDGARALPGVPAIYLTGETHHSFSKIAHMTGIGRNALRAVRTDAQGVMDPADLQRRIAEDRATGLVPLMVIGTAGTTATGQIDPLPQLAAICAEAGLWFHVDAAWGGAAIVSPALRHHLAGIEHADSITCDAHKWFSVAMGSGMFFCRHPQAVAEAFRAEAAYMPGKADGSTYDPYTHSAQWSRRFIGLKLFLSLAQLGEAGYAHMIEEQARLADVLRQALTDAGWRIVNNTPLPVVCFTREGLEVPKLLASLQAGQIAWMSETRAAGVPVIRACITSYRTGESDIHAVVAQINRIAAAEFSVHMASATTQAG